mmetsp:Transcript_25683/g.56627  ORF Transcript_25683/g.56627 Transcript_25683/m.56627 type:complete len:238 (+) Transcript_25683:708-1421(+)
MGVASPAPGYPGVIAAVRGRSTSDSCLFSFGADRHTISTTLSNCSTNQPFSFHFGRILFMNLSARDIRVESFFNARLKMLRRCPSRCRSYRSTWDSSAVRAMWRRIESRVYTAVSWRLDTDFERTQSRLTTCLMPPELVRPVAICAARFTFLLRSSFSSVCASFSAWSNFRKSRYSRRLSGGGMSASSKRSPSSSNFAIFIFIFIAAMVELGALTWPGAAGTCSASPSPFRGRSRTA